jgi:ubiquinone/menaquinone biosynthesis C-methylase UbiE
VSPAPPAPVPPTIYDWAYFLTDCGGFREYALSGGSLLEARLARMLDLANPAPRMRVLDLGCGRGELALHAALRGAEVVAVDYAEAALALASATLAGAPDEARRRVRLLRADAKALPFADRSFDRALVSDVVEHLHPWELGRAFSELARVLRPDGRLVVHTSPNRLHLALAYPSARLWARFRGRRLPANPRTPYERLVHVNEQDPWGLYRQLRAHFVAALWLEPPDRARSRARRALSPFLLSDLLGTNDIWVVCRSRRTAGGALAGATAQLREAGPLPPPPPWPAALAADHAGAPYFGEGWHHIEPGPPSFRWSGPRAELRLGGVGTRLGLELAGYRPPELPPARVTVARAGRRTSFLAPRDWQAVACSLPPGGAGAPLTLRIDRPWRPTDHGGADDRLLGVALRRAWWEQE